MQGEEEFVSLTAHPRRAERKTALNGKPTRPIKHELAVAGKAVAEQGASANTQARYPAQRRLFEAFLNSCLQHLCLPLLLLQMFCVFRALIQKAFKKKFLFLFENPNHYNALPYLTLLKSRVGRKKM